MGSELVKYSSQLARAIRGPRMFSPELMKKDDITFKDKLWVYNDAVVALLAIPLLSVGIVWEEFPLTMQWAATFLIVVSTVIITICCIVAGVRENEGRSHPLHEKSTVVLNHRGRRQLARYDLNRKRTSFTHEMGGLREIRKAFKQYSIWVDAEGKKLKITLLEHIPVNGWPYYWPRIFKHHITKDVEVESYNYEGYRRRPNKPKTEKQTFVVEAVEYIDNDFDKATEVIEKFRELARMAEGESVKEKYTELDAQRSALILRS